MKVIASNKRAYYDYFISDNIEAGVVLVGSEVKSVKSGGVSINESFITVDNGELILKNAYIKPYEKTGTSFLPNDRRNRKLLLNSSEIAKFVKAKQAKGMTIVPIKVYLKNGLVKIEIAIGKGKRSFDKRDSIAEKTAQMEIDRAMKKR